MTTAVKDMLHSFELLSDEDKRELFSEIIKKTAQFDFPPLSDNDLILCAENTFLELDHRELING